MPLLPDMNVTRNNPQVATGGLLSPDLTPMMPPPNLPPARPIQPAAPQPGPQMGVEQTAKQIVLMLRQNPQLQAAVQQMLTVPPGPMTPRPHPGLNPVPRTTGNMMQSMGDPVQMQGLMNAYRGNSMARGYK